MSSIRRRPSPQPCSTAAGSTFHSDTCGEGGQWAWNRCRGSDCTGGECAGRSVSWCCVFRNMQLSQHSTVLPCRLCPHKSTLHTTHHSSHWTVGRGVGGVPHHHPRHLRHVPARHGSVLLHPLLEPPLPLPRLGLLPRAERVLHRRLRCQREACAEARRVQAADVRFPETGAPSGSLAPGPERKEMLLN